MFYITLMALLLGTAVGYIVQTVFSALKHDNKWPDVPPWKKRALAGTGSLSALAVGLLILMQAPDTADPERLLVRMWFWQVGAAGGGATTFDILYDKWRGGGKK